VWNQILLLASGREFHAKCSWRFHSKLSSFPYLSQIRFFPYQMFFFSLEKWNYAFLLREKGAVERE
jgi:hypothetical protein